MGFVDIAGLQQENLKMLLNRATAEPDSLPIKPGQEVQLAALVADAIRNDSEEGEAQARVPPEHAVKLLA